MTKESEVVRTLLAYREELGKREMTLLKRMARLWLGVEREVRQEANILADLILQQAESGQPITPQFLHSFHRYKAFAEQAKNQIDYYDENIITLITDSQMDNMNLGLEAANQAILQSYPVSSPSWTQLHISAFETMAGMLGDGTPLSRLIARDYPFAIDGINQALVNGVTLGKGYKQIADDMVEASRMAFERSVLIARTEVNRAYRLANTEQYRRSGVVTGFRRLVYKLTACFACLMMDGEYLGVEQELYDHPRGKCSAVPVCIGGNSAEWQTGREWFAELSAEDQRQIMGAGRFEAWQAGEVKDLCSMVWMKPNQIWGPAPGAWAVKDLVGLRSDVKNVGKIGDELQPIFSSLTSTGVVRISDGVKAHIEKHRYEFDLEKAVSMLPSVLDNPRYVCSGKKETSFLFVENYNDNYYLISPIKFLKDEIWVETIFIEDKGRFKRRQFTPTGVLYKRK